MTTLRTTTFAIACALALAACPNRPQAPLQAPNPASITSFSVSPGVLPAPGEVVLEWGTAHAYDVTIEHVGVGPLDLGTSRLAGQVKVTLERDATFLISAQGAGGSDSRAASVTVRRAAGSVLFSAVPSTVAAGEPSTLVWNAPGARTVRLEEVGGASIDVGAQLESGSVRVSPEATTTYRLTADDEITTTTVSVAPTIVTFESVGPPPAAGEQVTLRWRTASATAVTLTRLGSAAPLVIPAGNVQRGQVTDTVPANAPPDGVLTYVLEATGAGTTTSRALEVPVGGGVRITSFNAPEYALVGSTFAVTWATTGGEAAEVLIDGRRAYLAQNAAEVAAGSYTLSAPTQSTRLELVVRNGRGAEVRQSRTVGGVGALAYNFFVADRTSIATPGEIVTLRWSVTNARNVRITSSSGAGFYRQFKGNVDSGELRVLPNGRSGLRSITYRLEADNGTGGPPISRTLDVALPTASTFTFSRQLPVRAPSTVTGITVGTTTAVAGFKGIEKNPAGESFIDIRGTGTPVSFGANNAANVLLPADFQATIYGTRINATRLNVSRFGWLNLTTSSTAVPGRPDNGAQLGAALAPLAIAPYWRNLLVADGQVHWAVDAVADARRLIVQWSNVRPTNGPIDARLTFQAQVYSNGRVVLAYRDFFKVPPGGTVGVVNNSQTDEIGPSTPVAAGETYRLFGPQPLPAPLRIEATPFAGTAFVAGGEMEVEGQANYPLNQFFVAEVNYRPAASVINGVWVEIGNNADAGVDLGGWDLDFGGSQTFQIPAGTVLPASGRLLLGQAADLGDFGDGGLAVPDGGVEPRRPADVLLPSGLVPPSTDAIVRLGIGGTEYTRFPSATTTLPNVIPSGRSYALEDQRSPWVTYQSATTRFICPSVRPRYGSNGQFGSPGSPNQSCFPYEAPAPSSAAFSSLAGTGTLVTLSDLDDGVAVVQLPRPIRTFGATISSLTIGANGGVLPYADSSFTFSNKSTPNGSSPVFVVAPFWDDLHGGKNTGLSALYWRQDTSGDVTISWERWSFFSASATNPADLNFQVVLFENGNIEFRYGTMTGTGSMAQRALGSEATVWVDIGPAAAPFSINAPNVVPNSAIRYELTTNR